MKTIEELKGTGKKYKTLSLSPKQGHYNNNSFTINNNTSIEKTKSNNNSPVSLKTLKNDYSLPKVLHNDSITKDSDREKIEKTNSSSGTNRKSFYSKEETYNFIFNAFYNKLIEAQNKIKANDTLAIIECFIKIFEYLAINADMKFKNINDIIKVYCDPRATVKNYKGELDSLVEQNAKLKFELDLLKQQVSKKDLQLTNYLDKLKDQELNITKLKSKIQPAKEMKEENKQLKDYVKDLKREVEFLREKEGKLMKVIYSIHKKGIAIDDLLGSADNGVPVDTSNDISTTTVYFPDKVHMQPKKKDNIPRLDFNGIPDYELIEEMNNNNNNNNNQPDVKETIYFNDINYIVESGEDTKNMKKKIGLGDKKVNKQQPCDYNTEFMQKYDEYSESWRNEIKQMKSFKDLIKKKK
jgi:cell division protein FtsB